jgi:ATP-dependent helicase/nuclease subunit A
LTWLPRATEDADWRDDRAGENTTLRWHIHGGNDAVFADEASVKFEPETRSTDDEAKDAAVVELVKARLSWQYPFSAATTEAAKTSVTAIRRRAADGGDDDVRKILGARIGRPMAVSRKPSSTPRVSAAERGRAHHLFLQLVDLERAGSEAELQGVAKGLAHAGQMKPEHVTALDFAAVAAFWQSDLGRRIRHNAGRVRRELAFTARFAPRELATICGDPFTAPNEDFVVVQGAMDLAVLRADEIWLVDFKTDELTAAQVEDKKAIYEPQLLFYATALERIYKKRVTEVWLHFLSLQKSERIAT